MATTLQRKKITNLSCCSEGINIGKLHFLDGSSKIEVTKTKIPIKKINDEFLKFEKSIIRAAKQINVIQKNLLQKLTSQESRIFDAHLLILKDPTILSFVKKNIHENQTNASYSYFIIMQKMIHKLSRSKSKYIQSRAQDLKDIQKRVLDILQQKKKKQQHYSSPTILVVKDTFYSLLNRLQSSSVKGIITESEISNSHFSIIARSLNLPTTSGLSVQKLLIYEGCNSIIDATQGFLIINPSSQELKRYHLKISKQQQKFNIIQTEIGSKLKTKDHVSIQIDSNMEFYQEINTIIQKGVSSVGLYRSEYLLITENRIPSEEEQYQIYYSISQKLSQGYLTIRMFDSNCDKNVPGFPDLKNETNPSMGLRSIRFSIKEGYILRTQLKAILRASATKKNIKILFPFISNVQEFIELKTITHSIIKECIQQQIPIDQNIHLGSMIEIPSAAISIEEFVGHADFFHIGTNDLIQFTQAVDRSNKSITQLYNTHHSSILKLILKISQVSKANNIPLCVCGEMATSPLSILILLALGIKHFSMNIYDTLLIKPFIKSLSYKEIHSLQDKIFKFQDHVELEKFFKEKFKYNLN